MKDVLEALQATPAPNILVISGVLFLFLAFVGKIGAFIEVPHKRQKWSAILGVILLVSGITISISSNDTQTQKGNTATYANVAPKETPHEKNTPKLSVEDLTNIIEGTDQDPKLLSKKYTKKSVSLKGKVTGSYADEHYMVVWIKANGIMVGCLSDTPNDQLAAFKKDDVVTVGGSIQHIENPTSVRNKLVLKRGCTVK